MDEVVGWVLLRLTFLIFDIVNFVAILFCDLPKLLKYGPRYWRVTREMRHRDYGRRQSFVANK